MINAVIRIPRPEKPIFRTSNNPLINIAVVLTVLLFGFVLRVYWLQVVQHEQFVTMSRDNRLQPNKISAVRGEIRASDGTVLAASRDAVELVYKGGEVKYLDRIAQLMKLMLPLKQPTPEQGELILKKDVPEDKIIALEEWLAGQENMELRYRVQRVYPAGLAGNLLGYLEPANDEDIENGYERDDFVPQNGLEAGLEKYLRGQSGLKLLEVDVKGRAVSERVETPATRGQTVTLSIIPKLQRAAERAIEEAKDEINRLNRRNGVAQIEKARGAIVALNPKTGQILALAVGPKYDPNWFSTRPRDPRAIAALKDTKYLPTWNRAVKIFEPGSTFKLVTNSALLENGYGNRTYQCFSAWRWGGRAWRNWNRSRNMGVMDARLAIANSCNTWYYQSAVGYGNISFANALANRASEFGFGEPTGIELIGESGGELIGPDIYKANGREWNPGSTLNFSIGQEFRATPLQIARMLATIANSGKRPELTVIKAIDGQPVAPKPMKQLEGKYWSMLKEGMRMTVTRGTAKEVLGLGRFPVPTAGKTGTAQSCTRCYNRDHAWYMGYGPFENPDLVVVAFFQEGVEGSGIALPAVKKVMAAHWNIPLDGRGNVVRGASSNLR
jgi:penicillin-binding protein 2